MTNLAYLYLDKNNLSSLPPEIGNLSNLIYLYLLDNDLNELPLEINNLSNLTKLIVLGNNLDDLPPEISNMSNLLEIDLTGKNLSNLQDTPSEIIHNPNSADFLKAATGSTLQLTHVLLDGNMRPPFNQEQKLIVRSETNMVVVDGCNSWSYPGIFDNDGVPYLSEYPFWLYEFLMNLMYCGYSDGIEIEGLSEFSHAMLGVHSYRQEGDAFWLYFGDSPSSNALIFERSP